MDKTAIYAGSFDPWTAGHQFVLDSALKIFDCIHIVTAVNPAKKSLLNPTERAQIIAHSIDPETNWWTQKPPFYLQSEKIIISADEGLIATYAEEHKIQYLIRGLRSTTDFEAEFNLYFSNHAINSLLQTWAVMCPPKLLHCSATYVKTVVGKQNVKFVGTHFAAQSLMLGWERVIGQIFDLIAKKYDSDMIISDVAASHLQILFTEFFHKYKKIPADVIQKISKSFESKKQKELEFLWELLSYCIPNGMDGIRSLIKDVGLKHEHFFTKKD